MMMSVSPSGYQWRRRESNPTQFACKAISPPWYMRPQPNEAEVRQGIEPYLPRLPRRRAAVAPADLTVIPDGIEPSSPLCKRGIVGHWTTGPGALRTSVVGRRQSARPAGLSFLPSTVVLRRKSRDTGIRTRTFPILSRTTPASWSMSLCVQSFYVGQAASLSWGFEDRLAACPTSSTLTRIRTGTPHGIGTSSQRVYQVPP